MAVAEWTKNLPALDRGRLTAIDVKALQEPWDGKINVTLGDGQTDVTPDGGYLSPALRRTFKDLRAVNKTAMEHVAVLPEPGAAYHFLVGDKMGLWDIIPALLARIAPQTIRNLYVSTLSFGSATAADILALIDTGAVQRIHFLVSVMFSAKNKHLYDELVPHLKARGHRAAAMRTHAKILAVELSGGDRYVVESSSNLRSCHCCEQVTVIRDDGLFAFHVDWMDRALSGTPAKKRGA